MLQTVLVVVFGSFGAFWMFFVAERTLSDRGIVWQLEAAI